MSNPIDPFFSHRGVRASPPDPKRPRASFDKHWSRTVRWQAALRHARGLVEEHGPEAALGLLNTAVGAPLFLKDTRWISQLQRSGQYGFILLPGGCHWALQEPRGGRCTFCEFQTEVDAIVGDLPISHEEFIGLVHTGLATMPDVDILNVFTAGSFLNPGEIPLETQAAIAAAVAAHDRISILRVESRVQYMLPQLIEPLVDVLRRAGKTLDIAIGFETLNTYLRNKVLRKGMSEAGFINAVKAAKAAGARVSAYVILMPTEMTEGEAIRECIESIKFAFAQGVDEVLLQARYSLDPNVKCPRLWSIVRVLRETAALGPVMLGRWEGELPPPKAWPQNCKACTPSVTDTLNAWRSGLQPEVLAEEALPECECRGEWKEGVDKTIGLRRRFHLRQIDDSNEP